MASKIEVAKVQAKRVGGTTLRWAVIIGLPAFGSIPFLSYYYYMKYLPQIELQRREREWRRPIRTTPLFVAGEEGVVQHYNNRAVDEKDAPAEDAASTSHHSLPTLKDPSDEAAFTALMLEEQRREEIERALREVGGQQKGKTAALKQLVQGSSEAVLSSISSEPGNAPKQSDGPSSTIASGTDLGAEDLAVEEIKKQIRGTISDPINALGTAAADPAAYVTDTYETLAAAVGMDERKKRALLAEQAYHQRLAQKERHSQKVNSALSAISSAGDSIVKKIKFQSYVLVRLSTLIFNMVPVAWVFMLSYFGAAPYSFAFDQLKAAFVALGPTYIKLGQWMATRPDLFPSELCHKLSTLFDSAPSHSWEYTDKVLRGNAGILKDITDKRQRQAKSRGDDPTAPDVIAVPQSILPHLESINTTPVNSGSVAQVYRARLREGYHIVGCATESATAAAINPRDIAIKVLHPHVRELIWADILVLKSFAKVFSWIVPRGRFLDPLVHWYEFSSLLLSQLNLIREAENLLEFRYNFRGFEGVAFPSPIMELCSPDVLVETFEEGHPLQRTQPSKALADLGVKMFLKMLFEDNFVHADLHPGNLLIRVKHADGTVGLTKTDNRDRNEIVVLDPGLVTSLSPKDRENFLLLFSAVACGNSELASTLMLERSPYSICPDPAAFRADMRRIFAVVAPSQGENAIHANTAESKEKNGFRLADVQMGDVLTDILNTMRRHQVSIDGHFATLVMTVVVGEGLGRALHPTYNLFAAAAPYLVNSLSGSEMDFLAKQLRSTYGVGELVGALAKS